MKFYLLIYDIVLTASLSLPSIAKKNKQQQHKHKTHTQEIYTNIYHIVYIIYENNGFFFDTENDLFIREGRKNGFTNCSSTIHEIITVNGR